MHVGAHEGPGSTAIGDVTGDGYPDVVQGASASMFSGFDPGPGELRLWRGTRRGPSRRPIVITQNTPGVPGNNQGGDMFGFTVAIARLDRDRYADIVVGAPGEDNVAGRVTIIRGARSGHARAGNFAIERGRGLPVARRFGEIGSALSLLDVDGDHQVDLALGAGPSASLIVAPGRPRERRLFALAKPQTFGLKDLGLPKADGFGPLDASILGNVGSSWDPAF